MPPASEVARRARRLASVTCGLALTLVSCGRGATDSPPLPETGVSRVEVRLDADSVLVGDSLAATARGVNRDGVVLVLATIVWSTTDSSIGAVTAGGVLRARNVGTVRLDVLADGAVGSRTIRVVPRPLRVRVIAPDTAELIDDIRLSTEVQTVAGVRLSEVAPRFASVDTSVAKVRATAVGQARVIASLPGVTELLAIVGRDTSRHRLVVRLTPLRSLSLSLRARVVPLGDSVPLVITAIDSVGRTIPTAGTVIGVSPAGAMLVRNGHLVAQALGRVVVEISNGAKSARDTITAQGPSEFSLEIVDGNGQRPLPLRVILSMERVAARWRSVIRASPAGEFVQLAAGECRNVLPVSQFVSGLRVLITLDTLPRRVAGFGGPCVVRSNGLPVLGSVQLNFLSYDTFSDQKLDDLLMHEVGHVLGLGTVWGRGSQAGLVSGDTGSVDPIFVGPQARAAFGLLGNSVLFTGRRVPLELRSLGHWRSDTFDGEVMAPALSLAPQPVSAVTVAALRDLGWAVELEAYDEFTLPDAPASTRVSARQQSSRIQSAASLEGDALLPQLMIAPDGRKLRLDPSGRPLLR